MILNEIRITYYPQIEENVFWDIVHVDPTYNEEKVQKKGRYTIWLLNLYLHDNLKEEDYHKATEYLKAFENNKQQIEVKDIGHYRNLPDLYDVVKPYLKRQAVTRKSIKREEATVVYKDEVWTIVIPHTWEASKLYGANTCWCTASNYSITYYNYYTFNADLYININRQNNRKYQMLVFRNSHKYVFCYDQSDRRVHSGTIGLSPGAIRFYNSILTFDPNIAPQRELTSNIIMSQVDIECYGLFTILGNDKMQRVLKECRFISFEENGPTMLHCQEYRLGRCFIDKKSLELTPVEGYDYCDDFRSDYAVAWKDGEVGVLDRKGRFYKGTEKIREIIGFCGGIAPVPVGKEAYNFIDEDGELLFDDNFFWCGNFSGGFCRVLFNDKSKGYISSDWTTLKIPSKVHSFDDFIGDVAQVTMRNGKNLLRKDGTFVFEEEVKEISPLGETGMRRIRLSNGHYTFCDGSRGIFTDLQFLECRDFVLGLAAVRTEDGRWNYLCTDGTLLLKNGVDYCFDFDREHWVAKIETYRGENLINTDGMLIKPWYKPKRKRLTKGAQYV